jgi:hypothetical protein
MTVNETFNLMQAINDIVHVDTHSLYVKTKDSAETLSQLYLDGTSDRAGVMYGPHTFEEYTVYVVNKY